MLNVVGNIMKADAMKTTDGVYWVCWTGTYGHVTLYAQRHDVQCVPHLWRGPLSRIDNA